MTDAFLLRHAATDADIDVMHHYLSTESYWAKHIPRDVVARSVANSLPFLFDDVETGTLAAFARVVTDRATFAYLGDVFVLPVYRGSGLGKRIMESVLAHPDLQNLRRFLLFTLDAHGLYARYGFGPPLHPDRLMTRDSAEPYAALRFTPKVPPTLPRATRR